MAGSFTITGLSATEPSGQRVFGPLSVQGNVVVGETLEVPLAAGDNSFIIPAGAVAYLLIPPENGTAVLKVRTSANSGDAGLPINGGAVPFIHAFPAGAAPVSLIVNSSAPQSAPLTIAFI
jgi:hypothetical protein